MTTKMFASDNNSGIHPAIIEAIAQANMGHVPAYGSDFYTAAAIKKFKEHFGEESEVEFVLTGLARM
ncbi:hypothetical protein [Planomicrobium okeanokoites]|uniref:hypothetical protein n=1 Tax=Planomicrobium okeanokoites TaxID=244 RepID=UPI0030FC7AC6